MWQFHCVLIVNFRQALSTQASFLVALIVISLYPFPKRYLLFLFKGHRTIYSRFNHLRTIFKGLWNFLVIISHSEACFIKDPLTCFDKLKGISASQFSLSSVLCRRSWSWVSLFLADLQLHCLCALVWLKSCKFSPSSNGKFIWYVNSFLARTHRNISEIQKGVGGISAV